MFCLNKRPLVTSAFIFQSKQLIFSESLSELILTLKHVESTLFSDELLEKLTKIFNRSASPTAVWFLFLKYP
jgi:hypothetical protein